MWQNIAHTAYLSIVPLICSSSGHSIPTCVTSGHMISVMILANSLAVSTLTEGVISALWAPKFVSIGGGDAGEKFDGGGFSVFAVAQVISVATNAWEFIQDSSCGKERNKSTLIAVKDWISQGFGYLKAIEGFMWSHIKPILQVIIISITMLVSSLHGTVMENITKCSITFYLVHITIPNYNWVKRIAAHTLGSNFKSFHEENWNSSISLFVFLHTTLYTRETKSYGKIISMQECTASCKPSTGSQHVLYFF